MDATFSLHDLIAHAAKTRELKAGTLVGTGTISNHDRAAGYACLMEARLVEQVELGEAKTPFLAFGDTVRIEMFDRHGATIFGAIEQRVERYARELPLPREGVGGEGSDRRNDHNLRGDYSRMRPDYTVDQAWSAYTPEEHALWRRLYARQAALVAEVRLRRIHRLARRPRLRRRASRASTP